MYQADVTFVSCRSLLHKLPGQYNLVEKMIHSPEGSSIPVAKQDARGPIMTSIAAQQLSPQPCVREYLLQGMDASLPCQLSVKYGQNCDRDDESPMITIAMTKSCLDC